MSLRVELIIYFENKTLNVSGGEYLKNLFFKTLEVKCKLMISNLEVSIVVLMDELSHSLFLVEQRNRQLCSFGDWSEDC